VNDALDEMADGLAAYARSMASRNRRAVSGGSFPAARDGTTDARDRHTELADQSGSLRGCRGVTEKMTGLNIAGGEDVDNAACLMIVGRNPQVADPPQWMALKQAKARGARLLVIDPFQTSAAEMADLWLRPRRAPTAAIALAMTKVLIDEGLYDRDDVANWCHGFRCPRERVSTCTAEWAQQQTGVPAAQIVEAARMFARGPSCFLSGHGIDAASNGVQTFRSTIACSQISAISIASAATGGRSGRKASKLISTFCSIRPSGSRPRSRRSASARRSSRCGRARSGTRWPAITPP